MRNMVSLIGLSGLCLGLSWGCDGRSLSDLYGGTPSTNAPATGGPATGETPGNETNVSALTVTINFSGASGFPLDQDPAQFTVGDGSIRTSGGSASTRGLPGLYADDTFAWHPASDGTGQITFNDLSVTAVSGYWVHPDSQASGATMTVHFSGGGSRDVASAPVQAAGPSAQTSGFFDTVAAPAGETITNLTFAFGEGGGPEAALDGLKLTLAAP